MPSATIEVFGEVAPVPRSEIINNAGVKYLEDHPKSKGTWCLRLDNHDKNECTYLHRTNEAAANYVIITGEPAPVPIAHLVPGPAVDKLKNNHSERGHWCVIPSPHEFSACKNIHLAESVPKKPTVTVSDEPHPVPVSHLLYNKGVMKCLSSPNTRGVWCNNKVIHNKIDCTYIHRRIEENTDCVNVDGEMFPVPVAQLLPNKAVDFLMANPHCSGRWCGRGNKHDVRDCSYLHRRAQFVRVGRESVKITSLASNRGLRYLLDHPEATGRWCNNQHDSNHPIGSCIFIHKNQDSHHNHGGSNSGQNSTNKNNNNNNNNNNNKGQGRDRRDVRDQPANTDTHVNVQGTRVAIAELVPNKAIEYLKSHTDCVGVYCTNTRPHEATNCRFVHKASGNANNNANNNNNNNTNNNNQRNNNNNNNNNNNIATTTW